MTEMLAPGTRELCGSCCSRSTAIGLTDELMISALHGKDLQTDVIDQLTPWRAKLIVQVCLKAGARLQHGTPQMFTDAVTNTVMKRGAGATGWWRQALGMPARQVHTPPPSGEYRPPPGWTATNNPPST